MIGGRRGKLFTDGRPVSHPNRKSRKNSKKSESIPLLIDTNPIIQTNQVIMDLPERPRPDGEEVETSTEETEQSIEEDLDNWEDWGESNPTIQDNIESVSIQTNSTESVTSVFENHVTEIEVKNVQKKSLPDILELDIKNQASLGQNDEFDFFQDMEPVIEASSKFLVEEENVSSKLNLAVAEDTEDGWVDEEW